MKFYRFMGLVIAPVLAFSLMIAMGCGGGKKNDDKEDDDVEVKDKPKVSTPLAITETGTLKGRVTLDGPAFKPTLQKFSPDTKNVEECHKGKEDELIEQLWKVSDSGGVADVVVWLKAPEGKFFKLNEEQRKPPKDVFLDQPHCAFVPHVSVVFPNFFDEKGKSNPTGQKFKVANSSEVLAHNSNIVPGNSIANGSGQNIQMGPQSPPREVDFISGKKPGQEDLIKTNCGIHGWMTAYSWVFDHPFATVTDKDGNFEIKNVPAGTEVTLNYWHESMNKKPNNTEKVTLKAGENQMNLKVKK